MKNWLRKLFMWALPELKTEILNPKKPVKYFLMKERTFVSEGEFTHLTNSWNAPEYLLIPTIIPKDYRPGDAPEIAKFEQYFRVYRGHVDDGLVVYQLCQKEKVNEKLD